MEFPNVPDKPDIEVVFRVSRPELDRLIYDLDCVEDPYDETSALLDYLRGL